MWLDFQAQRICAYRNRLRDKVGAASVALDIKNIIIHDRVVHDEGPEAEKPTESGSDR